MVKEDFAKKTFLKDMEGRTIEDIWFQDEVGSNDEAKNEIKSLFPDEPPFDTPKPERLLERIIHISTKPGDIVLDCFAGSGTTAAVSQKMGRRWVTCELIESSFDRYVKTRLTKVVNDEDDGGISKTQGVRIVAEDVDLPDGVTPDDLFKFNSVLNKVISADDELKKDKIIKILKAKTKTTKLKETINWRGGGGFQVAHLSPACFDYDTMLNRVVLTPLATGQTLVKSISANLGFKLLNDERANTFDIDTECTSDGAYVTMCGGLLCKGFGFHSSIDGAQDGWRSTYSCQATNGRATNWGGDIYGLTKISAPVFVNEDDAHEFFGYANNYINNPNESTLAELEDYMMNNTKMLNPVK